MVLNLEDLTALNLVTWSSVGVKMSLVDCRSGKLKPEAVAEAGWIDVEA